MRHPPSSDPNRHLCAALLIAALCPFVASLVVVPTSTNGPAIGATLAAQSETTIWDGVYTDDQAARGQRVYEQECAQCHLDDLMGDGIAPALIGSSFFFRWGDLSVGDMYVAIRTTMPQGAPASLSPAGYADISAYLLQMNKVPGGDTELPTDTDDLGNITITDAQEATLAAQSETTIWDGVYTDDQAARGQRVYEQECAQCHLDDLMGDGIAPALIGSSFFFRWGDLSVGDMYVAIRTTMPQGAPASLSPAGYADISAYLLQMNMVPGGDTELPTDTDDLGNITITDAQEATLAAQSETTIWDGVYTDDQAARGQRVYEQECAQCHLDDLMGDGIAPALIGSSFFFRWGDLSVGDMYVAIRTTMPQGAPASLSPAGYADISAYLLQMNKVPGGDTELPTDTDDLGNISITDAQ